MKAIIQLDGWAIAVDWFTFFYRDSFFVPSVNWEFDRRAIEASAQKDGCEIAIKGVVENDVAGLRVWCMKSVI